MKLKLKSDFRDFYDLWFDREGEPFERMMRNDLTRIQQLCILQNLFGLDVPPNGTAQSTILPGDDSLWVAHTDPLAHCGDGKTLTTGTELLRAWSGDVTVVKFVDGPRKGKSLRHLQIGERAWLLAYESRDDWRSNRGDAEARVVGPSHPLGAAAWPLFAIDFVSDADDKLWAIDLNTSPGMRGTGMEDVLKPREVVDGIKAWLACNRRAALT